MLDGAVRLLRNGAVDGTRKLLSNAAVARASGVPVSSTSRTSADRDWQGDDELLLKLAAERLFRPDRSGMADMLGPLAATGVGAGAGAGVDGVGQGAAEQRFVAAVATAFERALAEPTTVPLWQIHAVAAASHHPATYGDVTMGLAPADQRTAQALCEIRRDFDRQVAERTAGPLAVVLADLGRRPRPGQSLTTIVGLVQQQFDGAVLHHMVDAEAPASAAGTVAQGILALVTGLTDPIDN
jgi:hypothetical protein